MYCPNCFRGNYDGKHCTFCNYEQKGQDRRAAVLMPGMRLKNRYWIGRILGEGGFGITYLVYDDFTHKRCAAKEYFPSEFSLRGKDDVSVSAKSLSTEETYRHGIEKFMEEAGHLHSLKNVDNIVNVWDYFQENGTAYFVMDYLDGRTLKQEMIKDGGRVPFQLATEVLMSSIQTLRYVHQSGLLHRDISPENIFLTREDKVILIDFGAARGYLEQERNAAGGFSILLKPGFAPIEQYSTTGEQGTWTDVYALAATYYYAVSGEKVPQALENRKPAALSEKCRQVPANVSAVIQWALEADYRKRLPDMDHFYIEMSKAVGPVMKKGYISRITAQGKAQRWELPANKPVLMGRTMGENHDIDIVIDPVNEIVSREHCYVTYIPREGGFHIRDASKNGTFVSQGKLPKGKECFLAAGTMFFTASRKYIFLLEVE